MTSDAEKTRQARLRGGAALGHEPTAPAAGDAVEPSPPVPTRVTSEGLPRLRLVDLEQEGLPPASLVRRETLGEGGMGRVERAYQPELEREVAVKSLRPESRSPETMELLLREARITGALEHPGIVPIHGLGFADPEGPLVIMKLIQGTPWSVRLADRARGDLEALAEDLRVLAQVCVVAHFAHCHGVVHRDIKPANVMLGDFDEVYLVDWGIALRPGRDPLAETYSIAGTPVYMAPEMVTGPLAAINARTDVYLLGATLHQVLTGAPPHVAGDAAAVLEHATRSEPFAYGDEVPPELAALCHRACHADPRQRVPDALAFKRELERYLELRDARRILRLAEQKAEALEAALAARARSAEPDEAAESRVQVLLHQVLFGFEQALTLAPHLQEVRASRERSLGRMVDLEIGRGDARAARALLGLLGEPDDARRREVERLEAEERAGRERLLRLELDADVRVARRLRALLAWVVAAVALTWNVVVFWQLVRSPAPLETERGRMLVIGSVLWVIVVAVALIWRRKWLQTELNRRVITLLLLLFTGMLVNRYGGWVGTTSFRSLVVTEMILYAVTIPLLRQVMRPAYLLGGLCAVCALALTLWWHPVVGRMAAVMVTSILVVTWAVEWALRPAPRPGPR